MRRILHSMQAEFRIAILSMMQYRVQAWMELMGLFMEAIIYLVVWTTVAHAKGGEVQGYTAGEFASYFIAWIVVRNITTGWSPWWMERRIRRGDFNALLLRPVHPFYPDMARMLGSKVTWGLTLVPTLALLALAFRPEFTIVPWSLMAVAPALILAFLLRYTLMYAISLTAFWTTRMTSLFEVWYAIEFFISGRIAPLSMLPQWAQTLATYLPFKWTFAFPLELLLGRLTPEEAGRGFLYQAIWLAVTIVLVRQAWRRGVKAYAAVGG